MIFTIIICHDIDEQAYKNHPSQRRLDKSDFNTALEKLATGSDAKKVAQHLKKKTGKVITNKDIWNVKTKSQAEKKKNTGQSHLLIDFQEEINKRIEINQGKNNFKFIYDEKTKELLVMIYYQNDNMKQAYAKYKEILFIDGTYSINNYKYPLYLNVVKNCDGNSQIVSWALVAYERVPLLDMYFEEFAKHDENLATKTIVIDKDLTEWNALN